MHFAPTERSRQNLLEEGARAESVQVTGNTVVDALFAVVTKLEAQPELAKLEHLFFWPCSSKPSRQKLIDW